tara:strand:+ start:2522 stop:2746 length:225 start_codon:yes stop_codon:yes gene_type:complete
MEGKRQYAIIRLNNWLDGECNATVKMDFFGERNARSEWEVFISDSDISKGIYLLVDYSNGDTIAKFDTKDKVVV